MKTNRILIILFIVTMSLHSGCTKMLPCVHGNGDVVEVKRENFPEFNQIVSSGSFVVEVIHDTEWYVEIQAESNLISLIETKVNKGRLNIGVSSNHCINAKVPVKIKVHVPEVNYLGLSGSGAILAEDHQYNSLEIRLSGSGNIEVITEAVEIISLISGSGNIKIDCNAEYMEGTISGSGNILAQGFAKMTDWNIIGSGNILSNLLEQEDSECVINGSGNIHIWATDTLKVLINGSGNILYIGNPDIDVIINGSGKLIKA